MFFRHIISHATLFFSYHQLCHLTGYFQTKDSQSKDENHNTKMDSLLDATKVFSSGAVAGVIQDCVSHKYAGEKLPPINSFKGVSISSGIAFVAWEFSKFDSEKD